jgi:hypothetical protein
MPFKDYTKETLLDSDCEIWDVSHRRKQVVGGEVNVVTIQYRKWEEPKKIDYIPGHSGTNGCLQEKINEIIGSVNTLVKKE